MFMVKALPVSTVLPLKSQQPLGTGRGLRPGLSLSRRDGRRSCGTERRFPRGRSGRRTQPGKAATGSASGRSRIPLEPIQPAVSPCPTPRSSHSTIRLGRPIPAIRDPHRRSWEGSNGAADSSADRGVNEAPHSAGRPADDEDLAEPDPAQTTDPAAWIRPSSKPHILQPIQPREIRFDRATQLSCDWSV